MSPETTTTLRPFSIACRARVAITSSASKPATSRRGKPKTSHTRLTYGSCTARSSSIRLRVALYSVYCLWRKVAPGRSNEMATHSGSSSS